MVTGSAIRPTPLGKLQFAAAQGQVDEVRALLARGLPVDGLDEEGETALMKAVRANQPAAADLLRRRGASLDLKNPSGQSARDIAAELDDPRLYRALGIRK